MDNVTFFRPLGSIVTSADDLVPTFFRSLDWILASDDDLEECRGWRMADGVRIPVTVAESTDAFPSAPPREVCPLDALVASSLATGVYRSSRCNVSVDS